MQTWKCKKCKNDFTRYDTIRNICGICLVEKTKQTPLKVQKSIKKVSSSNKNTPAKFSNVIKEKILKRDGNMCIICECWQNHEFEFHHAYFGASANRGTDRNCTNQGVTLCTDCHHEIHHGVEGKGKLYRAKCIEYLLTLK